MRRKITVSVGSFLFLWLCSPLRADQVGLKNGDRLTGTIERSDGKMLVIKTEFAGEVSVQWPAIETISSDHPLHVGLAGGQMIVGPVSTADGQVRIATSNAGTISTTKDAIQVIRSDADQAAYDAGIDRLQRPHLLDVWSGLLDTGLSLTRGSSATLDYTLSAKVVRTTELDKIAAYGAAIYGRNDNTSPSQTIAHEIRGGVRGDVNLGAKWFAFGFTDFDSNALQHLDLQNMVGGGGGYHFIKTKNATFDFFGGAGYNQEYFSAYSLANPAPPPATVPFAAVIQRGAEMVAGEELDAKIGARTTFSESFSFYPGIGGPGGYRFTFNANASTKLNDWLGWQITSGDNYLSNPPFGIEGNDLTLSTGLRLTFGKGSL